MIFFLYRNWIFFETQKFQNVRTNFWNFNIFWICEQLLKNGYIFRNSDFLNANIFWNSEKNGNANIFLRLWIKLGNTNVFWMCEHFWKYECFLRKQRIFENMGIFLKILTLFQIPELFFKSRNIFKIREQKMRREHLLNCRSIFVKCKYFLNLRFCLNVIFFYILFFKSRTFSGTPINSQKQDFFLKFQQYFQFSNIFWNKKQNANKK